MKHYALTGCDYACAGMTFSKAAGSSIVIPAKAGIHIRIPIANVMGLSTMDPGLRRDDGFESVGA